MMNLKEIVEKSLVNNETEETQYHIHKNGREGGSNLYPCAYALARKWAGLDAPPKEGIRAKHGAATVGKFFHSTIQTIVREYFYAHINDSNLLENEVYEPFEIIPGLRIESPIDIALMTSPGYIYGKLDFRNIIGDVVHKHPKAKFVQIWDIKTISDMMYWKKVVEKEVSTKNKAQMHGYMHAAGLKEITILYVNRNSFEMFEVVCHWDQEFWDMIKFRLKRIQIFTKYLKNGEDIDRYYTKNDLLAFGEDFYRCTYCPYSIVQDDYSQARPKVIFERPCKVACALMEEEAHGKFQVGSRWKRGRSIIDILTVVGDQITSINTGNRKKKAKGESYDIFTDTIFYAMQNYEVLN